MNEQISSAGCNPLHRRDQKLRRGKRRITGKFNWVKSVVFFLLCATTAIALPAQTFTSLHSFNGPDGNEPFGLVQGTERELLRANWRRWGQWRGYDLQNYSRGYADHTLQLLRRNWLH